MWPMILSVSLYWYILKSDHLNGKHLAHFCKKENHSESLAFMCGGCDLIDTPVMMNDALTSDDPETSLLIA